MPSAQPLHLPTLQTQTRTAQRAGADVQGEAVQVDDGRDDGQTQAEAALLIAVFTAIEAPEYCFAFRFRNAGAGVFHGDAGAAAFGLCAKRSCTSLRSFKSSNASANFTTAYNSGLSKQPIPRPVMTVDSRLLSPCIVCASV